MFSEFLLPNIQSSFNDSINKTIYYIDGIPTILYSTKGDIARGAIVSEKDFSLTPCYIMRKGDVYAHSQSLHEAHRTVNEKFEKKFNVEERISTFKNHFPDFSVKVIAKELFKWHYYLTGSCALGKIALANQFNINIEKDYISIYDFIELSKDKFGWEVIKLLLP